MEELWLYVLRCEGDNYYVGTTKNLDERLKQHWAGTGAAWTQKWAPVEAVLVQKGKTLLDEDAMVKRLMLDTAFGRCEAGHTRGSS
jgi:predicted GIY-YIG superfamily endonuclease